MELKTCTKCGAEKSLNEFNNKKLGRGGKNPWCKACHNLYQTKWANANRETLRRKQRWEAVNSSGAPTKIYWPDPVDLIREGPLFAPEDE